MKSGAYEVQYSALNSTNIPASVAKDNGIERSGDTAVVMVTLQKPTRDAPLQAVPANVTGAARTLMGDKSPLTFRRVNSVGSVYSLATVKIADDQTLTFDLEVKAADGSATIPVTFNQTFYTR
ncbi:DUF4426 domain-containing protein [Salinisphaera aquimarina]|uniref:DUF4426 domain-containing protein n=1 Tax=Salinisphaera aquimarina TaxID=2094031 RepID=A0ABV7ETS4_9GAMM